MTERRELCAEEVFDMDDKKWKWFVFDMLQKGNKTMEGQAEDISQILSEIEEIKKCHVDLEGRFSTHLSDNQAHPFGISLKDKVLNKQNAIWGLLITFVVTVLTLVIEKYTRM
jgi:hypothetical protein